VPAVKGAVKTIIHSN